MQTVITKTDYNFKDLKSKYEGKVRDVYTLNNNNIIDMNDLEEIYKEFTNFINKRDELVKILQQQCKDQINLIKSMQFNTLQTIISKHFSQPGISTFSCNNCGKIFKTSKGLANHQRVCN